jgi:hypothetical protein
MKKDLVEIFQPFLSNPAFKETLHLVEQNSQGKIWIIGGFVYKNLISALYGTTPYEYDIDFIVEHKNKDLKQVDGWKIESNTYLNPNYVRNGNKMSFTDIHHTIRATGFRGPTIEDFIIDTPLTIQSIAYDIIDKKMIGEIGIKALYEKVVRINNRDQTELYIKLKNKTLEEYVNEKTKELGFKVEY